MTFEEAVNYIESIPKFTKKTTLEYEISFKIIRI